MRKTVAILAVCAVIGAAPATAWADTADDQYLGLLAKHGINGDPGALITAAHDVCDALNQPNPVASNLAMFKPGFEFASQGLWGPQLGQAQYDAINTYCPDKASWRD
ncbi:MAG: DUF732 domain-containing protein [Gemmatimonadales bacterium]